MLAKLGASPGAGFCAIKVRSNQTGDDGLVIRLPEGVEIALRGEVEPQWVVALVKGIRG